MNVEVSIIILNYNGERFLKDCFDSVLSQTYSEFEIIFFDNNSTDESVEFVRNTYTDERIKIVQSQTNLGFAGGNNEALKHAKNDLVVLLNNDINAEPSWLGNLVSAMKEKYIVASSYVITDGIDPRYYETNGSVSYLLYNVMNIFENRSDEFYPAGSSVIFRKSEIGEPFDTDYFYYSEDVYLGLKARFMGIKIVFVEDSVIHHRGGGTNQRSSVRTFYQERNRLLNLFTFFSFSFILRISPIILLVAFNKLILAVFSKNTSFWGLLRAYFWFIIHLPDVKRKRNELKRYKLKDESEIIGYMTSKLLNHESKISKLVNNISYYYSRLCRILPIEYYQKNA